MFSLDSPHRGHSDEYTKYINFNMKKQITLNYPKSAAMGFFYFGNSRGKRVISVRATEVLLYEGTAVSFLLSLYGVSLFVCSFILHTFIRKVCIPFL